MENIVGRVSVYKEIWFWKSDQFKGCDSYFEVNIFQILNVATNETSTLYIYSLFPFLLQRIFLNRVTQTWDEQYTKEDNN